MSGYRNFISKPRRAGQKLPDNCLGLCNRTTTGRRRSRTGSCVNTAIAPKPKLSCKQLARSDRILMNFSDHAASAFTRSLAPMDFLFLDFDWKIFFPPRVCCFLLNKSREGGFGVKVRRPRVNFQLTIPSQSETATIDVSSSEMLPLYWHSLCS